MNMKTFIEFCNQIDNGGTRLDKFLDWLDDEGEFMAGDVVSYATYWRKRCEYAAYVDRG